MDEIAREIAAQCIKEAAQTLEADLTSKLDRLIGQPITSELQTHMAQIIEDCLIHLGEEAGMAFTPVGTAFEHRARG